MLSARAAQKWFERSPKASAAFLLYLLAACVAPATPTPPLSTAAPTPEPPPTTTAAAASSAAPSVLPEATLTSEVLAAATVTPSSAPLSFDIVQCAQPSEITLAPFAGAGSLLVVAGDHAAGTYGLYRLDNTAAEPQPLILEQYWIGEVAFAPGTQRIIYSTYSQTPLETGGQNLFEEWVVAATDGRVVQRLPDESTVDPFAWLVADSVSDEVRILRIPRPLFTDSLADFTVLSVPSGAVSPYSPGGTLPHLYSLTGRIGVSYLSIDPSLTRALFYAYDTDTGLSTLNLRDVMADTTLWQVPDTHDVIGAGYGFSWPWSPGGERVALTFTNHASPSHRLQGDLFTLDRAGPAFEQVSRFADVLATDYFARAGPWSREGRQLLLNVLYEDASGQDHLYVADFDARTITDTCARVNVAQASWSPDEDRLALHTCVSGRCDALLVLDPANGEVVQVAAGIWSLAGWIP